MGILPYGRSFEWVVNGAMRKGGCVMRGVALLLSAGLIAGLAAGVYADDEAEQAAIAAKAAELAPAEMPEVQRIVALHRFVRDEIRQIKTQYG